MNSHEKHDSLDMWATDNKELTARTHISKAAFQDKLKNSTMYPSPTFNHTHIKR